MRALGIGVLSAALMVSVVHAEVVRFGSAPGFVVSIPDGWSHEPDPRHRAFDMWSPDRSLGISVMSGPSFGTLDEMVAGAAAGTVAHRIGPASISGYQGYAYSYEMTNSHGVHTYGRVVAVTLNANSTALALMTCASAPETAAYAGGAAILKAIALEPRNWLGN